MSDEIEQAETVAGKVSLIARDAWAVARQCDSFVEAADLYSELVLKALYETTALVP